MSRPKNSRVTYYLCTKYEKKYRKKVEKICPLCSGQMNEELKYDFTGKTKHKKIEKSNGEVTYSFRSIGRHPSTSFVNSYEKIPDEYTRKIKYLCKNCDKEFEISYLAEDYFLRHGVPLEKIKAPSATTKLLVGSIIGAIILIPIIAICIEVL